MVILFICALLAAGIVLTTLMPAVAWWEYYRCYAGKRTVTCPETHNSATVRIDARLAASTTLSGTAHVRLANCTRWPERSECFQDCRPEAVSMRVHRPALDHVVVVLATVMWWAPLEVLRYSPVGRNWIVASGADREQVQTQYELFVPVLLSGASALLLTYLADVLIVRMRCDGVNRGMGIGVGLGVASAAMQAPSWVFRAPAPALLLDSLGLLAGLALAGAILGGWQRHKRRSRPDCADNVYGAAAVGVQSHVAR